VGGDCAAGSFELGRWLDGSCPGLSGVLTCGLWADLKCSLAPSTPLLTAPLDAPVTGEVLEVNGEALENPDLVNLEPYAAGWLLRVRLEDPRELEDLISEEEYAELTTEV